MADRDFTRNSVLLVSDDRHLREQIRNILTFAGVGALREAINLPDALHEIARMDPDIIIADSNMVPVDGLEFTRMIRGENSDTDAQVPIILVSSFPSLTRVLEARDAGVTEILVKPLSANALLAHVALTFALPRPFVKAPNFVGPDRRRRTRAISFPDRRSMPVHAGPQAYAPMAWPME